MRDCILVKGSSVKKPYIAKVASFWQEKGKCYMHLHNMSLGMFGMYIYVHAVSSY